MSIVDIGITVRFTPFIEHRNESAIPSFSLSKQRVWLKLFPSSRNDLTRSAAGTSFFFCVCLLQMTPSVKSDVTPRTLFIERLFRRSHTFCSIARRSSLCRSNAAKRLLIGLPLRRSSELFIISNDVRRATDVCRHRVENPLDHRREFFERIPLFVCVGMPVISSFNAGNDVPKYTFRNIRAHASACHQGLCRSPQVMKGPIRDWFNLRAFLRAASSWPRTRPCPAQPCSCRSPRMASWSAKETRNRNHLSVAAPQ